MGVKLFLGDLAASGIFFYNGGAVDAWGVLFDF